MSMTDFAIPRKCDIPNGAYGVWQIPDLDIAIPVYKGDRSPKTQAIIDEENSASLRAWGCGWLIEDHADSKAGNGKWQIGNVTPDMVGFLVLPNETRQSICNRVVRAQRHTTCFTCDGIGVYPRAATDILCACCATSDAKEVYVAAFKYKCKLP